MIGHCLSNGLNITEKKQEEFEVPSLFRSMVTWSFIGGLLYSLMINCLGKSHIPPDMGETVQNIRHPDKIYKAKLNKDYVDDLIIQDRAGNEIRYVGNCTNDGITYLPINRPNYSADNISKSKERITGLTEKGYLK